MSLKTTEYVTKFGWTMLPYLPYGPDLAPSDFLLFGPVEELQGQHFIDNNAVINTVKKWTATAGKKFTTMEYRPSIIVGKNALKMVVIT